MNIWKRRVLPKPVLLTSNYIRARLREDGGKVDGRLKRMTPNILAGKWRTTPALVPPRSTPASTGRGQSVSVTGRSHFDRPPTASPSSYFFDSTPPTSTSLASAKTRPEDKSIWTSDDLDVVDEEGSATNKPDNSIITTTPSTTAALASHSSKACTPHCKTTESTYSTDTDMSLDDPYFSRTMKPLSQIAGDDAKKSIQETGNPTESTSQAVSVDLTSRDVYGSALTSKQEAPVTSRDPGIILKAHGGQADDATVGMYWIRQKSSASVDTGGLMMGDSSQSTRTGEMMMKTLTYLSEFGTLPGGASEEIEGNESGTTVVEDIIQDTSGTYELMYDDVTSAAAAAAIDETLMTSAMLNLASTSTTPSTAPRPAFASKSPPPSTPSLQNSSLSTVPPAVDRTGRAWSLTRGRREDRVTLGADTMLITANTTEESSNTFVLRPRPVLLESSDNDTSTTSTLLWSSQVVIPLLTVAVILALCLLIILVACIACYARKYCCCLAGTVGSYRPPHHTETSKDQRRPRPSRKAPRRPRHPVHHEVHHETKPTANEAQLATIQPSYRSVIMIGSDRVPRRLVPTHNKAAARRHWIVRRKPGSSWGNLSLINDDPLPPPPPPPLPVLPKHTLAPGSKSSKHDEDVEVGKRTVPTIVSLLEGRAHVAVQTDSQPNFNV